MNFLWTMLHAIRLIRACFSHILYNLELISRSYSDFSSMNHNFPISQQKCAITCCIKRTSSNCLKIKKLIWMESFHGSMPSLQSFMLEYSCTSHSPLNHSLYEHCNSNHTLFWVWHLNLCSICMSLMTRYYSHCFLVSSHLPQRCKGFVCQQRKANNFF